MVTSRTSEQRQFLEALGELVVHFSFLEDSLRDAIYLSSGESKVVQILTARLSFRELVTKWGAVCVELRLVSNPQHVKQLGTALEKVNGDRNELIHSAWSIEVPAGETRRYKLSADRKKGLRLNVRNVTLEDIHKVISQIENLDRKIWEIVSST